jgi:hypothetical protein
MRDHVGCAANGIDRTALKSIFAGQPLIADRISSGYHRHKLCIAYIIRQIYAAGTGAPDRKGSG